MLTLVCVLVWLACGFGYKVIADQRGSDLGGLAVGFFLGPLGLALDLRVLTATSSSAFGVDRIFGQRTVPSIHRESLR